MTLTAKSIPQILALTFGAFACGTPKGEERPRTPDSGDPRGPDAAPLAASAPMRWTEAFQKPAALLANQVRIEGPVGLIAHIATVSNADELERKEQTVPEGFLLVISVRPEAPGAEIAAQLDRLSIVALERLTILERPGPADVIVSASGNVYWADPETGAEKREQSLRIEGKIPR